MTTPQTAAFSISIDDDTVTFASNHPELGADELGWLFTIREDTPNEVVLQADLSGIVSSTRTITVKSAKEQHDGAPEDWITWTGGTTRKSSRLSHEDALRVTVEVSESGSVVSTGSGYFRVWDEGGGDG